MFKQLSQAWGYGVVIGLGLLFVGIIQMLKRLQSYGDAQARRQKAVRQSDFNTASRSVSTFMVASAIVSAWTWAATLLVSAEVSYKYGMSGGFWYASGASVQVVLLSFLPVEIKSKARGMRTFLELIQIRYGSFAHTTFTCFALVTSILVTMMMLLGGSGVVTALTGMDIYAALFL